jgi:hypothetical protein
MLGIISLNKETIPGLQKSIQPFSIENLLNNYNLSK